MYTFLSSLSFISFFVFYFSGWICRECNFGQLYNSCTIRCPCQRFCRLVGCWVGVVVFFSSRIIGLLVLIKDLMVVGRFSASGIHHVMVQHHQTPVLPLLFLLLLLLRLPVVSFSSIFILFSLFFFFMKQQQPPHFECIHLKINKASLPMQMPIHLSRFILARAGFPPPLVRPPSTYFIFFLSCVHVPLVYNSDIVEPRSERGFATVLASASATARDHTHTHRQERKKEKTVPQHLLSLGCFCCCCFFRRL